MCYGIWRLPPIPYTTAREKIDSRVGYSPQREHVKRGIAREMIPSTRSLSTPNLIGELYPQLLFCLVLRKHEQVRACEAFRWVDGFL